MKLFPFQVLFFLLLPGLAVAQYSKEIRSDRPGQGNGPYAVGQGGFQLQAGFDVTGSNFKSGRETTRGIAPNFQLRYGLTKHLNINVNLVYTAQRQDAGVITNMRGPRLVGLGARINLREAEGLKPGVGLQATLKMPPPSGDFKTKYPAPRLTLLVKETLTEKLIFLANLGLENNGNDGLPTYFYVANLGYSLGHGVSLFVENYGNVARGVFSTRWDGGLAWIVTPDLQVDAYGGAGYNRSLLDYFGSLGFSWRFGRKG